MDFGKIQDVAEAGLVAQRARLAVTASNLANAEATRTPEGGPYRRKDPVFRAVSVGSPFGSRLDRALRSVTVTRVVADPRPPVMRFQPGHPDADAEGYVQLPHVDPVEELANLMSASRSYEANLLVVRKAREMGDAALQIGR
ncbi:MAG TPA: flagellar basal body rod protein FlgC [Myxococcota bacterium]|jgi:flagellar basal-body rod protein FlgC|nr:flagellar basal body rod protein FlgC [Myxococcota bacterium]